MIFAAPFRYPQTALVRRHGPQGYSKYSHHRPWLRDEFDFRCVYCLKREQWCFQLNDYQLDHLVPQSIAPALCREYTNLVYACSNCNHRKGAKRLPTPEDLAYGACMEVLMTGANIGEIVAHNDDGIRLIDELGLDQKKITGMRKLFILSIRSHQKHDRRLFLTWMGLPDDLPDLANVRPQPERNMRIEGIVESWFCRKPRPEFYE